LQIILCGQPELEAKMKDPNLRQLRQRVAIRARTHALNLEETGKYIQVRLAIAGASAEPIFSPESVEAIFEYSRGIPRVINLMCEHALITGFADQLRPIPPRVLRQVAKEFELDVIPPIRDVGENLSMIETLNSYAGSRRDEDTDKDGVER
jgi:general secretion pathway protein A